MDTDHRLRTDLDRILDWIQTVDKKIAPVLTIDTTLLAVLAGIARNTSTWTCSTIAITAVTGLLLVGSLASLALVAFPRTEGPSSSLIFFGKIAEISRSDYVEAVLCETAEEYKHDLAQQCHRNAEIATTKYFWFEISLATLFVSIVPWVVSCYVHLQ